METRTINTHTPKDLIKRMAWLADQERRSGTLEPYFLYFTDPEKPAGQRFLGACIVEAHGLITAVQRAHQLGINPGGAVIPYDTPPHDLDMRDRLITSEEEMAALGYNRRVQS
jgi:hypothetical protein